MAPNALNKAVKRTRPEAFYYHEREPIVIRHGMYLSISAKSMPVDQGRHVVQLRYLTKAFGNPWVGVDPTGHYIRFDDNAQGRQNLERCQSTLEGQRLFPNQASLAVIHFDAWTLPHQDQASEGLEGRPSSAN